MLYAASSAGSPWQPPNLSLSGMERLLSQRVLPHVQAIVLCDHIYRDDDTGKCVIAGTFNHVYLHSFPGEYQPASIYLNLSDFHGHHTIAFRFVRLSDQQVLDESPGFELHHNDRREHHECIFDLPPLEFPEAGRFTLEILYDGETIGHADVEAMPIPDPEEVER